MKLKYWLLVILSLSISGCGDVDWFPSKTVTTDGTNGGTTLTAPTLSASISPTAMLNGRTNPVLTLKIRNKTGNAAQSGLQFSQKLPNGFIATDLASECGGIIETNVAKDSIIFRNGILASGIAECTITANLDGTTTLPSVIIKAADFSGFGGGLRNGVNDQTLTVFPVAVTSGAVTASISSITDPSTNDSGPFTVDIDTHNNSSASVNVTVTVVAVDANGASISSTTTPVSGLLPALSSPQIELHTAPIVVTPADLAKIEFWRILSVTVQ